MASNGDGTAIDMASNGNGDGTARVVVPEIKFTKLFINGEFVDAASGTYNIYMFVNIARSSTSLMASSV
jgi:hypothetical protein